MSGVKTKEMQLARIECLLREGTFSYAALATAVGLKDSSVRRYVKMLQGRGLRLRVAGWENPMRLDCRPLFTVGTEPDVVRPRRGVRTGDTMDDAVLERLITRENAKKLAKITPRRDPIITMFFGEYQRGN